MRLLVDAVGVGTALLAALGGCAPPPTDTASAERASVEAAPPQRSRSQSGIALTVSLSGAEEIPGPGDPDGVGTAHVAPDEDSGEVCVELKVENVAPVTAVHIHAGAVGASGPIVISLVAPSEGTSERCAAAGRALIRDIARYPARYYIEVHNAEFPQGALRGQLQR